MFFFIIILTFCSYFSSYYSSYYSTYFPLYSFAYWFQHSSSWSSSYSSSYYSWIRKYVSMIVIWHWKDGRPRAKVRILLTMKSYLSPPTLPSRMSIMTWLQSCASCMMWFAIPLGSSTCWDTGSGLVYCQLRDVNQTRLAAILRLFPFVVSSGPDAHHLCADLSFERFMFINTILSHLIS